MKFCKNEQSGCTPDCSFCLLGHFPNPLGTLDFSNGCAFLRNAFVRCYLRCAAFFVTSISYAQSQGLKIINIAQ